MRRARLPPPRAARFGSHAWPQQRRRHSNHPRACQSDRGGLRRGRAPPARRPQRAGPVPVPCREDPLLQRERGARLLSLLRLRRARRRVLLRHEDAVAVVPRCGPHGGAALRAARARGGLGRGWGARRAPGPRERDRRGVLPRRAARTGPRARDYLAQRGIRPDTIERFGLGYAPGGGDALARHLRAQALPLDDAVSAGLVMRRTAGGVLDRFRDRLIFPIADLRGRVVAFGGRVLPGAPSAGDPQPKYLNSPESPIFHKGRSLYGLTLARDAIRERGRVAVVEGYLDVIAVAQAGIGEVVAPLGTALTADQLGIVSRFTERVIACFDGDAAGRRAAARSSPPFSDAGLWGRGVFLPSGDDPDTFVRAHGGAAFGALLDTAEPLIEAWLAEVVGPDRDAVRRRAEAAREVARLLQRLRSRDPDKFD